MLCACPRPQQRCLCLLIPIRRRCCQTFLCVHPCTTTCLSAYCLHDKQKPVYFMNACRSHVGASLRTYSSCIHLYVGSDSWAMGRQDFGYEGIIRCIVTGILQVMFVKDALEAYIFAWERWLTFIAAKWAIAVRNWSKLIFRALFSFTFAKVKSTCVDVTALSRTAACCKCRICVGSRSADYNDLGNICQNRLCNVSLPPQSLANFANFALSSSATALHVINSFRG